MLNLTTMPEKRARHGWDRGDRCVFVEDAGSGFYKGHFAVIHKVERGNLVLKFDQPRSLSERQRVPRNTVRSETPELREARLRGATSIMFTVGVQPEAALVVVEEQPRGNRPKKRKERHAMSATARRKPSIAPAPEPVPAPQQGEPVAERQLDAALESLDTWVELGEELKRPLLERREKLLLSIEEQRRELVRVDMALRVLGTDVHEVDTSGVLPQGRAKIKRDEARAIILAVLSSRPDGLRANQIAALVIERDSTIDRYDVSNTLPTMVKARELIRTGSRGSYVYTLPPPPPGLAAR